MPHYYRLGDIPSKRHTQFRNKEGVLYSEELVSTEGFDNIYSLVYHCHPPTLIKEIGQGRDVRPEIAVDEHIAHRKFFGFNLAFGPNYIADRIPLMVNNDVQLSMAAPTESMVDQYFKNATADEVIFIHHGEGTMHSIYGELPFKPGDYVVIPRGTIYQMRWATKENKCLIIESSGPVVTPKRYRNKFGQHLEHSPFCERDFRKPEHLVTHDEKGEFVISIKKNGFIYDVVYASHPFDAIGWDGYLYPYAFSIHDFEPITGRVHQPPPVHQTFSGRNFVICSFVPRLYDYHPEGIPAPYNHSNVDSDEVLYYVEPKFMSRNDVQEGMLTLHPLGIPHGPHHGAVENSIGKKGTEELAVMVDTFHPLKLTKQALSIEDEGYHKSWV